jgi:hypothetical protein
MLSFFVRAALAAALISAAPAFAAPSPATSVADDPARMAAAEKLLTAMHYDTVIDRTQDSVIKQIQKDMPAQVNAQLDKPLPPEVIAKLQAMIEVHFRKAIAEHRAQMRHATLLLYCEHFTTAELERLAQIESDPVMIKMQAELPQIAAESLNLGRGLVADELPKIKEEAKALIIDYYSQQQAKPGT